MISRFAWTIATSNSNSPTCIAAIDMPGVHAKSEYSVVVYISNIDNTADIVHIGSANLVQLSGAGKKKEH